MPHPPLTDEGRNQAKLLQCNVPLQETDILIASPTIRTLQTATIWSAKVACQKLSIHMYPHVFFLIEKERQHYHVMHSRSRRIKNYFRIFDRESTNKQLWTEGINTISENSFQQIVEEFLLWCYELGAERICIVSHDGTITAYRKYLQKVVLTRADFCKKRVYMKWMYPLKF